MAISNASSGLRPGVCSSTTRPQAPFEGQMIFETDTNRVLIWDNSAWVMIADTDQPPGLQLIKTQTIGTGVSSVTVSDAFSADYDNYKIVISGGAGSLTGATLNMTLGATATGYYFGSIFMNFATASLNNLNGNNTTSWSRAGVANPNTLNGEIELFSPNLAKRTHYNGRYVQTVGGGNAQSSGGFLDNATQYTAFTLTAASGTITGGTIRVYGYRN